MISIVVPCYNCEKTLERCVDSILKQTCQCFELLLVDDGSVDKTYEICKEAVRSDKRVKTFHQKNRGLMNAWKRGVVEAAGEFIIFCDSDDYIDSDLVGSLEIILNRFRVDLILYGAKSEYEDGSVTCQDNRLEGGYYTREEITHSILPFYFSDGRMESGMILSSRCTKLFRRELLIKNFDYLSDKIHVGEDGLTTFAAILSADSVYCMKEYYPYHYMRNDDSMIGKYDALLFQKFLDLREQMYRVADVYNYAETSQIEAGFLSNVLLCMKKEICRNKKSGYKEVKKQLTVMRENATVESAIRLCSIKKYDWPSKIFAWLIIKRRYFSVCMMTWAAEWTGMGKA